MWESEAHVSIFSPILHRLCKQTNKQTNEAHNNFTEDFHLNRSIHSLISNHNIQLHKLHHFPSSSRLVSLLTSPEAILKHQTSWRINVAFLHTLPSSCLSLLAFFPFGFLTNELLELFYAFFPVLSLAFLSPRATNYYLLHSHSLSLSRLRRLVLNGEEIRNVSLS